MASRHRISLDLNRPVRRQLVDLDPHARDQIPAGKVHGRTTARAPVADGVSLRAPKSTAIVSARSLPRADATAVGTAALARRLMANFPQYPMKKLGEAAALMHRGLDDLAKRVQPIVNE